MKRFFPVLLAVMLVVFSVVPASASSNTLIYSGVSLPDISGILDNSQYSYATIIDEGESSEVRYVLYLMHDKFLYFDGVGFKLSSDTYGSCYTYNSTTGNWKSWLTNGNIIAVPKNVIWANYDIIDNATGAVYQTFDSPSEPLCDGSTCPVTDLNADGVCDDCGMTLSLRLVGYPSLPSVTGNNYHGVVLQREDGYFYMALTSDLSYSVSGSVTDVYLITVANENEVDYVTYKCTDGKNWVHQNTGKAYSLSVGTSSSTLLASSFDWYKDGELFFQKPPLWMEMGLVTQGEMSELTMKTAGTMKILVLCGVGLMASLAVLSLFGKRSLISRR